MNDNIFKNRTFVLLFIASLFAVIGFSMFLTTTTWYVIRTLDMNGALGMILIAITVPRLVMMTYGGVVADKYKKTTIMFCTNLMQALLLLVLTLLLFNDALTVVWLLVIGGLFGMLDAFFGPASTSMIPKIIEKSKLQKANAYFQGVDQISFIIGPALAGIIMEVSSVTTSFFVAFILVGLSAIFVFPPLIKEAAVEKTDSQTPLQNLKEGFSYVKASKFLVVGILVLITMNFFVFGTLQIGMPLIVDLLGGTPINLSYMEVSLSTGMIAGTLILGKFYIRRKGQVTLYGLIAALSFYFFFGFLDNLILLAALLFFVGFAISFVFVPFFAAAQEITENRMMGRVMSLIFLAMNGFDPIAYAIVSILTSIGVSIQFVIVIFAIIGIMITIVLFFKAKDYRMQTTE
ncbi:MFS transporter [Salinicoccus hispanicus]|uniref:MFS transporter n=1 Tax=Salinicoccus hispanicus TaxID=157225 RepID=A0A6N8U2G1_9STAP|nr:MFS transporter [Salinicoccus hispanicus]MXQ51992.1 MFS transporter [Salinicoccus hispanicus]